jgi:hypothetical protein
MKAQILAANPFEEKSVKPHDNGSSIFQPDTLAGQQYFDTFRRAIPQHAETRLMLAILEDAIACYKDNFLADAKKKIQLFEEARAWFHSDDASWVFSFVSICSVLEFEPDYFRQGLKRWEEHRRRHRKTVGRREVQPASRLVA